MFACTLLLAAAGACSSGKEKTAVSIDAGDGSQPQRDAGHADAGGTDASSSADSGGSPGDGGAAVARMPAATAGSCRSWTRATTPGTTPGTQLPEALSETGLYMAGSTSTLAPGVVAYEPRYVLWSDGAEKKRYLYLPPGAQIDTSDMDRWTFPVGTKVWKEFSRGGKRLETRLLWKNGETGWFQMAFVWNADGSDALAAPRGAQNVGGTAHDVPARNRCSDCHDGSSDKLLGISAIQLSHDLPGVNLKQLAQGWTLEPAPSDDFRLRG